MSKSKKIRYFIDAGEAAKITQMPGLETTILTGFRGEKIVRTTT